MLAQNNSGQELLLLIRRSMRQGDVENVYHVLSQTPFAHSEEICLRYKNDLKRFQYGVIDAETWCMDQIRNFDEIIHWPDFQENKKSRWDELDKILLLRLVNSFELEKALTHCEVFGDSSILMQARYKLFEKMYNEGQIELETWELIRQSTQHELWELSQSKETPTNFYLQSINAIKKWLRRLFR